MWNPFISPNKRLLTNISLQNSNGISAYTTSEDFRSLNKNAIKIAVKWVFAASGKRFTVLIFLSVCAAAFYALFYPVIADFMNYIDHSGGFAALQVNNTCTIKKIVIIVAIISLRKAFLIAITILGNQISHLFSYYSFMKVFSYKLYSPLRYFDDSGFYDVIRKSENALGLIEETGNEIITFITNVVSCIVISLTVTTFSPLLAIVIFLTLIPLWIAAQHENKIQFYASVTGSWQSGLKYVISEYCAHKIFAADIRAARYEEPLKDIVSTAWHDTIILEYRTSRKILLIRLCAQISFYVILFLVIYLIVITSSENNANIVALGTASFLALLQLMHNYSETISSWAKISRYSLYLSLIEELDHKYPLPALEKNIRTNESTVCTDKPVTIRCEKVSYQYPEAEKLTLDNITFSAEQGTITAIIGVNGSGKTTLMKILSGLFTPTDGTIYWNNKNYEQQQSTIRESTGIQFQNIAQWPFSVQENITLYDTEEEFDQKITQFADILDFVTDLPEKYRTRLTQELGDGIDLSGGQWQKIGIVRALYHNPQLIILDEATSALDVMAEQKLYEYIKAHFTGKTTFLVTHRLTNLHQVDRIIILHKGAIAEQGTFTELMENQGIFYTMYQEFKKSIL